MNDNRRSGRELDVKAALAARLRDLQRLVSGGLPDLQDAEVMRAAWQR